MKRSAEGLTIAAPLPEDELRRWVAEAKQAVELAVFMSAPLVRIFAGGIPEESEDACRLWGGVVASFREVADYGAEKGIFVGLHNHPPVVAPGGDDILRLLREIDRENVTFILDTGQWHGSPGAFHRKALKTTRPISANSWSRQHRMPLTSAPRSTKSIAGARSGLIANG